MANPAQWTADQVLQELGSAKARLQAEFTTLGENNALAANLYAQADQIQNPASRSRIKGALQVWANRQVQLQNDFNTAYAKYQSAYNAVASFFRSVGLEAPPDTGLSGLGIAPAVIIAPAIVVGVVAAAIAFSIWVHDNNVTQQQGLKNQAALLQARIAGQITDADFIAASADTAATAKPKPPPGGDWIGIVLPALGLVALIVLGPQLMRALPARKGAA